MTYDKHVLALALLQAHNTLAGHKLELSQAERNVALYTLRYEQLASTLRTLGVDEKDALEYAVVEMY